MYLNIHIQNGNVHPCVHLGIYYNSTNQVLMDRQWFTEQIRLNQLCQYRCICTLKISRWCLQTSVSVPEQTFAFKVLHHSGDGKKFKNILHVYIPCTLVALFSFLVRLFNHSLLIFKLFLDWKLVSFGPFLADVISGSE